MKRRRGIQSQNGLSIPMTPLIDIVFLLLIYFMLASNFIEEQQFIVDLPKSSHGTPKTKGPIVVTITKEGQIIMDQKKLDKNGLEQMLKGFSKETKARGMEIRAEKTTPVELIVEVMDIAKSCRIKKVKIATQAKTP